MTTATASLHLYGSSALLSQLKNTRLPLIPGSQQISPYLFIGQNQALSHAAITEHEIDQELQRQFNALPSHISALLSFEDFKQQSDKLMPAVEAAIKARRKPNHSEARGYMAERFDKVGYLRLFNSALSAFGWEYLADNYRGLCIELDASSPVFKTDEDRLGLLKPVNYGGRHDVNVSAHNPIPGFFMDHPENELRHEWRAAFMYPEPQTTLKIPARLVKALYLSVHADESLVESSQRMVSQDIRYRHVKVHFVVPDEQQWRLSISP